MVFVLEVEGRLFEFVGYDFEASIYPDRRANLHYH